ncbi:MAG: SIS domain-containing protein [Candidatus Kapaibacterium sp.]
MMTQERIAGVIERSLHVKELVREQCIPQIDSTGGVLCAALGSGKKLLFCGNGGSAADAQHIAAELVIRFRGGVERRALPAMSLSVDPSLMTAGGNDYGYENVFARAVEAFGQSGDVLVAISTSGTSKNVVRAVEQARLQGMSVIGLLGGSGGTLVPMCDQAVVVPSTITAHIQECHIMIGHIWCEMIEEALFPELFS